jgi:hypothetical protein
MRNKIKFLFPLLVILILAYWPIDYAHGYYSDVCGQGSYRVESNAGGEFPFRSYVTPDDMTVQILAGQVNGAEEAYKMAVQWTYVSEQELNHVADKWLTPREFLANTPHYTSNPLQGMEVSDCEEQANTLVSLLRAKGIGPEVVRVALGEVKFNDVRIGHAWAELLIKGDWVALDPGLGPYWDGEAGKLVQRQGVPFDHYASNTYPVLQVWAYYSDIYFLDPVKGRGDAPASWYTNKQVWEK